jgi:dephospho-CoA kinase
MIIVVVGRAGSGKTVAAREICRMTGLPLIETSDIVRSITKGTRRQNMNLVKDDLEAKNPDWLWNAMKDAIFNVGEGPKCSCVISGIREPYLLYRLLNDRFGDVIVLGVEASPFTRYIRLCDREYISVEDFRKTDDGTLERDNFVGDNTLGIDITLTRCDKIFDTNGTTEDLAKNIQYYLFSRGILGKSVRNTKQGVKYG